jgi:hypothetical protein
VGVEILSGSYQGIRMPLDFRYLTVYPVSAGRAQGD